MKPKKYTHGITFFVTAEMYQEIKSITDAMEIGVSDFIRGLVAEAFERAESKFEATPDETGEEEVNKNGSIT